MSDQTPPAPEPVPESAPESTPEAPVEPSVDLSPVPAPPPGAAPAQWPSAGYSPAPVPVVYPAAPPYVQSKTSSNAVVALVLAVLSWAFCPLIPAIVALVFASNADKEITASGGQIQGRGLVTAAKIVAWINIGVSAAVVVIGAFVLVILVILGGTSGS